MYSVYVPWFFTMEVSLFGNLRVEAYLQLTAAYRSLSRPSSAPCAKAFTLCSCSLELSLLSSSLFELLEFHKQIISFGCQFIVKRFYPLCFESFSTFRWNCNLLPKLERPWFLLISISFNLCPLICSFLTLQYFIRFSMNIFLKTILCIVFKWWAQVDSNHRPRAYQARALTTWAMSPC